MSDILQGIDAIIFDFGNVFIDLDYPKVIRRFSEVAKKNEKLIEELVVTNPILQEFEVGAVAPDEFRWKVNNLLGTSLMDDDFDDIWNSMLKEVPPHRMEMLLKVGEKYKTYILSNSNVLHEIAFDEMILEATGKESLRDFVNDVYFSHEIGLRKPNQDCYQHVIEDIDNYASRMLFLDDRLDNVEAARQSGMKAIQILNPDQQLKELFNLG
jgi:glucose-1-phosphatase